MTVNFLGPLRDQVGAQSLVVELSPAATYRDLLDSIAADMEAKLADWAWDRERHAFSIRMMVTRNLSADLKDEVTCLADGDQIHVLLPLAGG
ncbi:MAG: MoaD/ThiS family protein [Thermoleophilia bacterium]|nr:MoaD/ThiS family protein [Thermoleophilia bacterium]